MMVHTTWTRQTFTHWSASRLSFANNRADAHLKIPCLKSPFHRHDELGNDGEDGGSMRSQDVANSLTNCQRAVGMGKLPIPHCMCLVKRQACACLDGNEAIGLLILPKSVKK